MFIKGNYKHMKWCFFVLHARIAVGALSFMSVILSEISELRISGFYGIFVNVFALFVNFSLSVKISNLRSS
jgi:hypothetical protein